MAVRPPKSSRFDTMGQGAKALLLATAALVVVAAMELSVRTLYAVTGREVGSHSSQLNYLPYVGFRYAPLADAAPGLPTDKLGFITDGDPARDLSQPKAPDEFRVFVFGGSTVAGVGLPSADQSIPAHFQRQLDELFRQRGVPLKLVVVNAGVAAYFSAQELTLFNFGILPLEPDYVVFLDGSNDFIVWGDISGRGAELLRNNYHDYQADLFQRANNLYSLSGLMTNMLASLGNHLALADLTVKLLTRGHALKEKLEAKQNPAEVEARYLPRHLRRYEGNIVTTLSVAAGRHIGIAYLLQPSMLPGDPLSAEEQRLMAANNVLWHGVDYFPAKARFFQSSRETFVALAARWNSPGVVVGDLSTLFQSKSRDDTLYTDHVHYTPEGSRRIAAAMTKAVGEDILSAATRRKVH